MERRRVVLCILVFIFVALSVLMVFSVVAAQEAQAEAERYHKLATSDVVYSDEELKALYYQNKTMIELLREIRELLKQQLIMIREKKGE